MRILLFAVLLAAGCASTAGPPTTSSSALSEMEQAVPDKVPPQAICPSDWTCDFQHFFASQSACLTACGTRRCFKEPDCELHKGCSCP
jgi:hypothetical protein